MKKTLAILLALLMTTSVALVSCNNSTNDTDDDDDFMIGDDWENFGDEENENPETDENGETIKVPNGGNSGNSGNSGTVTTDMQEINDKVYVLYTANIREKASSKTSTKILAQAAFGTELSRSHVGTSWSKVSYKTESGATVEGYVSNELITTKKETVTFAKPEKVPGEGENQTTEAVVSKLKPLEGKNYRLRHFPLANGYPHTVTLELGEVGQIKGGTEVTILELSEDKMWAKVKCTAVDIPTNGNYPKTYGETAEGYIPYEFIEASGSGSSNQPGGPSAG